MINLIPDLILIGILFETIVKNKKKPIYCNILHYCIKIQVSTLILELKPNLSTNQSVFLS